MTPDEIYTKVREADRLMKESQEFINKAQNEICKHEGVHGYAVEHVGDWKYGGNGVVCQTCGGQVDEQQANRVVAYMEFNDPSEHEYVDWMKKRLEFRPTSAINDVDVDGDVDIRLVPINRGPYQEWFARLITREQLDAFPADAPFPIWGVIEKPSLEDDTVNISHGVTNQDIIDEWREQWQKS